MPNPNFTEKLKKAIKFLVKFSATAAFIVLVLTMLPAALTEEDSVETTRPEISMSFDEEMPDMDPVARPDLFPHFVIVYPEADAWGKEEAAHIKALIEPRFHSHVITLSDTEYLALDGDTLLLYNAEPSLTLNLGINALIEGSYLEVLSRLGGDGLEVKRTGNRIDITSASFARIREATDKLLSSLVFDGTYIVSDDIYVCDERPSAETDFKPDFITDSNLDILTFSYIDGDAHTLRAIEGIVAHTSPDLVVFNGNLEGNSQNRHDLAVIWQAISDILKKTDTPWCFIPGSLSGNIPRITLCEVISSFDGCLRHISGDESASFSLTVANSDGIVTASIYFVDTYDNNDALCEIIEKDSKLYARASSYPRNITAIFPAVPEQIYTATEEITEGFAEETLTDVFDSLSAADADSFICVSDTLSASIIECSEGKVALCGSIGFTYHGLGGRFDYNNSLRGGVLLSLTPHRSGYTETEIKYIYAADLGLNER